MNLISKAVVLLSLVVTGIVAVLEVTAYFGGGLLGSVLAAIAGFGIVSTAIDVILAPRE